MLPIFTLLSPISNGIAVLNIQHFVSCILTKLNMFQMKPQGKWMVYWVRQHGFIGMHCDCATVLQAKYIN